MAKSLRSKSKRAFRSKKREEGIYAATAAARLHRLNTKLQQVTKMDKEGDAKVNDLEKDQPAAAELDDSLQDQPDSMVVVKKLSTHGPRGSRREEWRKSKGLPALSSQRSMNRQGGLAARRRAGRSKRRR